jgi:hypothetical protein
VVQRLRVQHLEVGTLTVHRLNVLEGPRPNTQTASAAGYPPSADSETPEHNGEARPAPRRRRPRKPPPA